MRCQTSQLQSINPAFAALLAIFCVHLLLRGASMQRSLWHGAISFGLIYVPVDLLSATKEGGLALHLLDSRDFSLVGYQRINKSTGKEVDWQNIVKGYEYEKGQYVALTDSDFKHANIKATETIAIANFANAVDIPAMYYETPYHLRPAKGGEKVYSLLRQALSATKKVAVATFVMRGRQHLCVIAPNENHLMLLTLRFADELLPPANARQAAASTQAAAVNTAELSMAIKLVAEMSGKFKPEAFKDTYRADLLRRAQEKIKKKQTHTLATETVEQQERPKAQVIDLMAALKNSLKRQDKAPPRNSSKKSAARISRRA
jgi:DNA end-binding protein Ku